MKGGPTQQEPAKRAAAHLFAAITAAGESTRMGQPKPLLSWGGCTFLEAMIRALAEADLKDRPAVVIGADRELVLREVRRLGAEPLLNPDYRAGRFTSIRLAARWAREKAAGVGARGSLLLWPVDCPGVLATTLTQLRGDAFDHPACNVVPAYDGRGGHPVILCEPFLEIILSAAPDANLRELMASDRIERRLCPVDDPAVLENLNGPEDYAAFLQSRAMAREEGGSGDEGE